MRGLSLFVGFIAIMLAMAPATVLIGRSTHEGDVDWLPVLIAVPVAIIGFLICRVLRAAASRRYVALSIQRGRAGWSPAFAFSLLAWLLISVAGGLTGATFFNAQGASGQSSYQKGLADYPLPVLFLFAGLSVLGAAGYYAWVFRRRYEIPALESAGVAILVQPPVKLPKAQAVKLRTRMWLQGAVIEALLFLSGVLPRLFSGDDRPSEDELVKGALMIIGGPGIISFALLLVMLALWPTRRSALQALTRPSSLVAIGIVLLAFLIDNSSDNSGQKMIGGIMAAVGVLLGSMVCMNIMDRGAQPWLGFVYLAGNYVFGYLTAPDGNNVLPTGFTGWLIALIAAAYAIREARAHWHTWTKLEPLAKITEIPAH